jgi:hypothetical protein
LKKALRLHLENGYSPQSACRKAGVNQRVISSIEWQAVCTQWHAGMQIQPKARPAQPEGDTFADGSSVAEYLKEIESRGKDTVIVCQEAPRTNPEQNSTQKKESPVLGPLMSEKVAPEAENLDLADSEADLAVRGDRIRHAFKPRAVREAEMMWPEPGKSTRPWTKDFPAEGTRTIGGPVPEHTDLDVIHTGVQNAELHAAGFVQTGTWTSENGTVWDRNELLESQIKQRNYAAELGSGI